MVKDGGKLKDGSNSECGNGDEEYYIDVYGW